MSATDLSNQLAALSDSLKTTNALINRLAKLQFQPGTEPLEGDQSVRIELAQDIHDSLRQLAEELEVLTEDAEDYKFEGANRKRQTSQAGEEARLSAKVTRLSEELTHSRQQFRNAQLAAKLASDEAKRKEREAFFQGLRKEAEQIIASDEQTNGSAGHDRDLLFAHRGKRGQKQKQLTKDEILVNASSDVTAGLRRTHDLLSTELSRSRFAQETFDEATAALAQLGEDYSSLGSILGNSRELLGTLLRSQKSDTWYLETAFYILLTTLCWLFFRRILYGPFFKLPVFLWRCFAFLTNWIVLRPLFFLLSTIGVVEPVTRSVANTTSSRTSLIVQLSATAKLQAPPGIPDGPKPGVAAGAGGLGAKVGKDPILEGELSEQLGEMAEQSTKQKEVPPKQEEKELPRRGDGTVLQERGDVAKNPKKKNFDVGVEDAKHEAAQSKKRDEL